MVDVLAVFAVIAMSTMPAQKALTAMPARPVTPAHSAVAGDAPRTDDARRYAAWRPLLAGEMDRGGWGLKPQDLYKFLHQGVQGPAHAVVDTAAARAWLRSEWEAAGALSVSDRPPLLQPLRPDGRLARIDLVRLRHHLEALEHPGDQGEAGSLETLLLCFIETAASWPTETVLLQALWAKVQQDTLLWADHFTLGDLAELHAEVDDGWPAVRHSAVYRNQRRPHYRVVAVHLLPDAWRQAGQHP